MILLVTNIKYEYDTRIPEIPLTFWDCLYPMPGAISFLFASRLRSPLWTICIWRYYVSVYKNLIVLLGYTDYKKTNAISIHFSCSHHFAI
jgi:hypothetical protein